MNPDPFPGFLLGAQPTRPTSRGHLEIRSPDPFEAAAIHPNYLATDKDVQEMLEAAQAGQAPRHGTLAGGSDRGGDRARPPCPVRRGSDCRLPHAGRHRISSGRDLSHGPRCVTGCRRCEIEGSRRTQSASRGCLDISDHHVGEHQRAGDHGRREGGKHHPGRVPVRAEKKQFTFGRKDTAVGVPRGPSCVRLETGKRLVEFRCKPLFGCGGLQPPRPTFARGADLRVGWAEPETYD